MVPVPLIQTWVSGAALVAALVVLVGGGSAQDREVSLAGAIDFHVHSGPDSRPRSVTDLEVARMTSRAGLRGIVLKNHFTMTADRAALAMAQVEGLEIFGGVVLNRAVGGINPEAVRQMVQFDGGRGKVVWLPTFDAEYYVTAQGGAGPFVSVMRGGAPVPELSEIFTLVAENDLVLAMGHSSPEEVLVLIPEARRHGVEQILVTHVFSQRPSRAQMQQMADAGAILEIDWYAVYLGNRTVAEYVSAIQEIGAEHFLMSSDLGQATSPSHVDGLRAYVTAFRNAGLTEDQIDLMLRRNPARLLGLEP
ncbi:MAG: histidinol phosphatase [Gemmatimonadetes bacterium]|nr:histidinol phosphatase [Gemmatimonadota bacterium]